MASNRLGFLARLLGIIRFGQSGYTTEQFVNLTYMTDQEEELIRTQMRRIDSLLGKLIDDINKQNYRLKLQKLPIFILPKEGNIPLSVNLIPTCILVSRNFLNSVSQELTNEEMKVILAHEIAPSSQ